MTQPSKAAKESGAMSEKLRELVAKWRDSSKFVMGDASSEWRGGCCWQLKVCADELEAGLAEKPAHDVYVYQKVVNAAIEYIATDPEFDAGNWSNAYDKLHAAVKEFTGEGAEKPADRPAQLEDVLQAEDIVNVCSLHSVVFDEECDICEYRRRQKVDELLAGTPRAERPQLSAEQVRGALARGYCHKSNSYKILDSELCEAMANEIMALLTGVAEKGNQ
jgi:hypothetical protein